MTDSDDLPPELARTLDEVEREHVLAVLQACEGRRTEAARILGLDRKTLRRRLARWGIDS